MGCPVLALFVDITHTTYDFRIMWEVLESMPCKRQLKRALEEVVKQYEAWKEVVHASGPRALRLIPGYRDHALRGEWKGARSSYLTKKWRVLYVVEGDRFEVLVLEVNPHDY